MAESSGFITLTVSGQAIEGDCLLYGVDIDVSVAGALATLYEGFGTEDGRLIRTVKSLATVTNSLRWFPPVYIDRGLYVVLAANVTLVTLYLNPVPEKDARYGPRSPKG